MKFLKNTVTSKIIIDKSIFISVITSVDNIDETKVILDNLKKEYPKANHYCSATIIDGDSIVLFDDDGEPSRTAGYPILEVLKHKDLTNVYAVVIRYFGGIKLGAGGLVRAYMKSVSTALETASYIGKKTVPHYLITFSYDKVNQIDQSLKNKVTILNKDYQKDITYEFIIPNEKDISLISEISHLLINTIKGSDYLLSYEIDN